MTQSYPTDEQVEKALDAFLAYPNHRHIITCAEDIAHIRKALALTLSAVNPYESVHIPQSISEARVMALVSVNYLEQHAPEYLRNISSPPASK